MEMLPFFDCCGDEFTSSFIPPSCFIFKKYSFPKYKPPTQVLLRRNCIPSFVFSFIKPNEILNFPSTHPFFLFLAYVLRVEHKSAGKIVSFN